MRYNDTTSAVFKTLDALKYWFEKSVKARNDWLTSNGQCGCYMKFESLPQPDSFPVLVSIDWHGSWEARPTFIYPDQIRILLESERDKLEEHNEVNNLMEDREI